MALALRWAQRAGFLTRAASTAPSVYDKIVTLTIVDRLGRRHTVRGLEGQTVVNVIESHSDTLGDDVLCLSPMGQDIWDTHIAVPNELLERIPLGNRDDELALEQLADPKELDQHSRLASKVVLSKELNGALIALKQVYPWRTL